MKNHSFQNLDIWNWILKFGFEVLNDMSISEVYECKNRAMYSYFNILYIRPFGLLKKK